MKSNWVSKLLAISVLGILIYIPLATGNVESQENSGMNNPPPNPNNQFSGSSTGEVRMPKNVQVLTGLTLREVSQRMQDINKDLGVKCNFCHVSRDFPSDEKQEKLTARKMMKMTNDLNQKYFGQEPEPKITCYTCHRGQEKPVSSPTAAVNPSSQPDSKPPLRFDN